MFNIENNNPEKFITFIETLEKALGRKVEFEKVLEHLKVGDVPTTSASINKLQEAVGFKSSTSIEEGLQKFMD